MFAVRNNFVFESRRVNFDVAAKLSLPSAKISKLAGALAAPTGMHLLLYR